MSVEFQDFSVKVTEAMSEALIAGLYEATGELQARTKRNSRQGHTYGDIQATALWDHIVEEGEMKASVGSQHEAAYWEEFGTGEHAVDKSKSRKGWWVYTPGNPGPKGSESGVYADEQEAQSMVRHIRRKYKKTAVATNGRDPQYTLQNAFKNVAPKAKADLENKLKEGMS
jgi:hypothetical protein